MKAMILAAGRGKRMMPLTKGTPKPLLKVAGKPLIQYTIEALVAAGITELVINHAYLGAQIEAFVGDGQWLGATVQYSKESIALETGGGILQALPLLGNQPFLIVNSDIWTDFPYQQLLKSDSPGLAHLIMVDNPEQHPEGDFFLGNAKPGSLQYMTLIPPRQPYGQQLTYSGIAIIDPKLFTGCRSTIFRLRDLLVQHMETLQVTGEYYRGQWLDIGTPERLTSLNKENPATDR
ncbi:MAG: nucleotidyltransferase family protein [Pseudomonadales bacterium]|nr:nucleotidyltransferase family protein [Pseudomonadales bacterium]